MANEAWTWADLDDEQLALVRETERTLGPEVVVAYRRAETSRVGRAGVAIPPATLNDSQLDVPPGASRAASAASPSPTAAGRRVGRPSCADPAGGSRGLGLRHKRPSRAEPPAGQRSRRRPEGGVDRGGTMGPTAVLRDRAKRWRGQRGDRHAGTPAHSP